MMISKIYGIFFWPFRALGSPRYRMFYILLLGFLLRLVVAYLTRDTIFPGTGNADQIVQNLIANHRFAILPDVPYTFNAPGYYYFLAAAYSVLGRSWFAIGFSQALVNTLTCYLVFRITEIVFDRKAGYIAALYTALYPYTVYQAGRLIDTTLYTFCLLILVGMAIWVFQTPKLWRSITLGLVVGLSCLVRSTILVIFLAIIVWFVKELGWKKALRIIIPCLLSSIFVIAPWTLRNWQVSHRFVLIESKGWYNAYKGNNPATLDYLHQEISLDLIWQDERVQAPPQNLSDTEIDQWYKQQIILFIKSNPWHYLKLLEAKFLSFWSIFLNPGPVGELNNIVQSYRGFFYTLSYIPLLILALIGIALTLHYPETRLVLMILCFYTFVHLLIYPSTRLRIPLDVLLAIFSGFTIKSLLMGRNAKTNTARFRKKL